MLIALSEFLHGRDFPMLGIMPSAMGPLMRVLVAAANRLPKRLQETIYTISGANEAIPARTLRSVSTDAIAEAVVNLYPRRPYPAMMIGSSNGALIHLCALMGIPWLPQTALIPVARSGVDPDEPRQDVVWAE